MDKEKIKSLFSKAASSYDRHAWLPQEAGEKLLQMVSYNGNQPKNILDIGCGTGDLAILLGKRFRRAKVIGFDLAWGMVKLAKEKRDSNGDFFLQADLERIPFKVNSFEMVVSNLVYQRVGNLDKAFIKVNRILIPQGRFYLSLLTEGALNELQSSFISAHKKIAKSFPKEDYHHPRSIEIKKALRNSGFRIVKTKEFKKRKYYTKVDEIIKWLKSIGANYYYRNWAKGLNSRPILREMKNIYKIRYGRNGKIPATFIGLLVEAEKL